jgi:predicted kinase
MNAPYRVNRTHEDPEMEILREALGAVAIAPSLAYSLTRSEGSRWLLRRIDARDGREFERRDAALAAMRRAVVHCSAYCLLVEGCNGTLDVQFLNWDERAAARFGIRP